MRCARSFFLQILLGTNTDMYVHIYKENISRITSFIGGKHKEEPC